MATAGANINNIGIKMTPLLNWFIITNNIFAPNLILKRRSIIITNWATSVVNKRKKVRSNRKEYHSISRARKVRSEIVALYCNILKVSQVLTFSTLGRYSFPFYKRMEKAPRLTYGITKVHNL